jgi:penicillin-binding protein 1A
MTFQKKSLRSSTEKNLRKWSFSSFSKRRNKKHRPKRHIPWLKILMILVLLGVFFIILGVYILSKTLLKDLPPITRESLIFSESTILYDSTGEEKLYTVHGDLNRKVVSIDDMSPHITSGMLAAEDDQFFTHSGFDIGGIIKAGCHEVLGNMGGLCPPRGGSTITQQMIKNFFLTSDRTMARKLREIVLAYKIEQEYSKEEILEIYLNGISFGSNLGGVEIASDAFFNKSAKDITPAEAAVLASMPQAPTRYSPFGENVRSRLLLSTEVVVANKIRTLEDLNSYDEDSWELGLIGQEVELYDGAKVYLSGRADWVLSRMNQLGYITQEQFEEGKEELKNMTFEKYRAEITAPHFVMWVRDTLEEKFGTDLVEHGGLKVITTIDMDMQQKAEEAIANQRERNAETYDANNAALISLDPKTGDVKAMVGSADYWDDEIDGKVNVLLNKRLPGSSFKPIAYAAAFVYEKLTPATVLFDVETDFGNDWVPKNYNGRFSGPVTVRYALGQSLNIPAVKATIIAGPDKVYELATQMGISFDFDSDFYGAAISLGGAEARPMDMASAFSTFANGGRRITPNPLLRVEDRYGNILFSAEENINLEIEEEGGELREAKEVDEEENQVLDEGVAYLIADMLSDPTVRGSGWNERLQLAGRENLVKTGTADKKVNDEAYPADCWTIGGVPQLMTAVWTGNTKGQVLAKSASGYGLAAPIWKSFMESALEGVEPKDFEIPSSVRRIQVSKLTGFLPPEGMPESLVTEDLVASMNTPWKTDDSLSFIEIDSVSRKLPTEYTPRESIIRVPVLKMHSYFPTWGTWENPVQDWLSAGASAYLERLGVGGDVLFAAPTEYDDVHTPVTLEGAPTVQITSGKNVSSPQTTVLVDITAENGFEKILFSWNDRLLKSFTTQQNAYIIPVPPSASGLNTIKAEVFDKYSLSGTDFIDVRIEKDTTGPNLTILSPQDGSSLSAGAFISFSARAIDDAGAVQKVSFLVDGKSVGTDVRLYDEASTSSYEYIWQSPSEAGAHTLEVVATDVVGNRTSKEVSFTLNSRTVDSLFAVFSPKTGSMYACSTSVPVSIGISADMKDNFERLEIIAEDASRRQQVISSFTKVPVSGFFDTTFAPAECGEWKIFARVYVANGNRRTSGKATVTLQE